MEILLFVVAFGASVVGAICGIGGGVIIKPLLDALERSGISGVLVTRSIDHALSDAGAPRRFQPQDERIAREHATTFGVCGLMSMILNWHHSGYQLRPDQMAEIAVQLLTKPLFVNAESY